MSTRPCGCVCYSDGTVSAECDNHRTPTMNEQIARLRAIIGQKTQRILELEQERDAALDRADELEALVRIGFQGDDDSGRNCCPWCHNFLSSPEWFHNPLSPPWESSHRDDCPALAALAGGAEEETR